MTPGRTNRRWFPMLALVAVATMVNYLDRTVLGIAAPYLTKELGLTAAAHGHRLLRLLVELRAAADSRRHLPRPVRHAHHLFARADALVGLHRADGRGHQPAGADPRRASASASSRRRASPPTAASSPRGFRSTSARAPTRSIRSASTPGIAFLSVPLFWVTQQFGWRGLFFLAGGFGIVLGALFWWLLSRAEPETRGRTRRSWRTSRPAAAANIKGARVAFSWSDIGRLLRHRQIIGASIGQFGGNSTQVFFVTWFPTYLVNVRGMSFINAGMMTMLPYIGASIGVLVARPVVGSAAEAHRLGEPRAQAADRRRHAARLDDRRSPTTCRPAPTRWSSRSCRWRSSARA